jgi:hypothetical protein
LFQVLALSLSYFTCDHLLGIKLWHGMKLEITFQITLICQLSFLAYIAKIVK